MHNRLVNFRGQTPRHEPSLRNVEGWEGWEARAQVLIRALLPLFHFFSNKSFLYLEAT
jgi:hypothetical protein